MKPARINVTLRCTVVPLLWAVLSQADDEVIDARVYVGIHYRNSDTTARA